LEAAQLEPWASVPAAAAAATAPRPVAPHSAGASCASCRSILSWPQNSGATTGRRAHRGCRSWPHLGLALRWLRPWPAASCGSTWCCRRA